MTYKQFRTIKLVIVMMLAAILGRAVILNNYWLAATTTALAIIIIFILRSRVREVIADERDYQIAGKAARYAMTAFTALTSVFVFILMASRDINPLYETIGAILAYAVCALMFFYSLIFTFLSKSFSRGRKILFYVLAGVLILFFAVFSLRLLSGEDDWICDKGQWIKHGNPSFPAPTKECK